MELKALSVYDIKKWNLTLTQARNYLRAEQRRAAKLNEQLQAAQLELTQTARSFYNKISGIKMPEFDIDNAELEAIIGAISNLRSQNIATQAKINQVKAQTKKLKEKQVEIGNTGTNKGTSKGQGSTAYEKYKRVMEGLTSRQADLRETWPSEDVLEIDDYVMEYGVSYDEALEAMERKRGTEDSSQPLSEDE